MTAISISQSFVTSLSLSSYFRPFDTGHAHSHCPPLPSPVALLFPLPLPSSAHSRCPPLPTHDRVTPRATPAGSTARQQVRPSRLAGADGTDSSQLRPSEASERTDSQQLSLSRPVRAPSVIHRGRSLEDSGRSRLTNSLVLPQGLWTEGRGVRHLFPFFFRFIRNVLFTEPLENRFLFSLGEFIVLSLLFFFGGGFQHSSLV